MTMRGLTLLALVACGCGSGDRLFEVTGTVQFQGQPLPAGQIFFDPDYLKSNDGPPGFAFVRDGKFDTRGTGRGVVGGPYKVRIEGFDGKPGNELPLGRPICKHEEARVLPRENSAQHFTVPSK